VEEERAISTAHVSEELGTLTSQGDTRTVELVHLVPAAPAALWPHFTVPEQIAPWMRTTATIFEPSIGGNVHFVWGDSGETHGTIMMFDAPHTLAFTWHEHKENSSVRFDLTADDAQTSVRCRHRDIAADQLASIAAGWHTHLEFLAAVVSHATFEFDPRFDELLPRYEELAAAL
jgi:uncharacterized protein YndB with AHSA1/START domain